MRFSSALASLGLLATAIAGDVSLIKGADFEKFITTPADGKPVLVKFYAPWCGHCKALAPEYEAAATLLKSQNIRLAEINCDDDKEFCRGHGVTGYPTLKVYHDNKLENPEDYTASREAAKMAAYLSNIGKPPTVVTADNIAELKEKTSFILFHEEGDTGAVEALEALIKNYLSEDYQFGHSTDRELAKAEGADFPGVLAFKQYDEPKGLYAGELKADQIAMFIESFTIHYVGDINRNTYSKYASTGRPLGYIFVETEDQAKEFSTALVDVAKKHRQVLSVGTIDANKLGEHAPAVNLEKKWPAFSIEDFKTHKKYVFDQEKELTPKALIQFIEDYAAGKVEPKIKSEPIPDQATQDASPALIVVNRSFEDLVINNDKDVLVEYYAPWCGHCKALAPKYDELATKYKEHANGEQVAIAKIDATVNDVDYPIRAFPTIILYPAGNKDKPVAYEGSREIEDLAAFIASKGTHGVDAFKADKVDKAEEKPVEADKPVEEAEKPVEEAKPEAETAPAKVAEPETAAEKDDSKDEL